MSQRNYRQKYRSVLRRLREARMFAQSLKSPHRPILAHVVPVRRCNLACTYCNEFDNFSKPVPTDEMLRRLDRLAELGTTVITFSGGEPLLHPDLDELIRRVRRHGALAGLLTNGYLLTPERIRRLNRAGLDYLQISVDNVMPDEVSKKSLKVLDKKLQHLAEYAEFQVNINSVLGSAVRRPEDALTIARRVLELGHTSTVGVIHDHTGQLQALNQDQQKVYREVVALGKKSFATFAYYDQFQQSLLEGRPNDWRCRAGSRYLYVCEDGLVHYCSQQRGYPGIALERYTPRDLEREYHRVKSCAPYCTISCVHQVSIMDEFRAAPLESIRRCFPARAGGPSPAVLPTPVRILTWLFLPSNPSGARVVLTSLFRKTALKLLGVR